MNFNDINKKENKIPRIIRRPMYHIFGKRTENSTVWHVMKILNWMNIKIAVEWDLTGKRPRERPKKRWPDGMKRD